MKTAQAKTKPNAKDGVAEMAKNSAAAAKLLRLLASAPRLRLLCLLVEGEQGVLELAAKVGLSQSAMSQHLALLRTAGLVSTRRDAQRVLYSLQDPKAKAVLETLYKIYCGG